MLLLLLSRFSRVLLCATLWTVARQAPLSMGFSWQEYWSGLPCPLPEDLLTQGLNLCLLHRQADSSPLCHLEHLLPRFFKKPPQTWGFSTFMISLGHWVNKNKQR